MIVNTQEGLAVLEKARLLFADLDELTKTSPDDARQIAAEIASNVRNRFGISELPLLGR